MYSGSTQTKWYLVQVDMDQSDPFYMKNYGVYLCRCYIRKYEDCKKISYYEVTFCSEIRTKNWYGTLGKLLPARQSKVHNLLQNNQSCVWYQYYISLDEDSLVGTF